MKFKLALIGTFVLLLCAGAVTFRFYSYIFSREVSGEIVGIERVSQAAILAGGSNLKPSDLYSFAVAIRDANGEIVTASTEDRQWAVVQSGQCAEARYFPYPPWQLDRTGTYYGARLLKLYDCNKSGASDPEKKS